MYYYIRNLITFKVYGPFSTLERAKAFKKKYHIYGTLFEKPIDK